MQLILVWHHSLRRLCALMCRSMRACLCIVRTLMLPDKGALRAQQQLELEVETGLLQAVREAKRQKDPELLQLAIHSAVTNPSIPADFRAVLDATTELIALQNQARFRLKLFLDSLEIDKVKANGSCPHTRMHTVWCCCLTSKSGLCNRFPGAAVRHTPLCCEVTLVSPCCCVCRKSGCDD